MSDERDEKAPASLEEGYSVLDDPPISPGRARSILDERARLLARECEVEDAGEVVHVVTFEVAEQRYGVELDAVREVLRLEDYTPVPGAPPAVVGIANVHGEMLALVDFRAFLDLPARGVSNLHYLLVLTGDHPQMGILVDGVGEMRAVMVDDIADPPASVAAGARACVRGVTPDGVLLLNGAKLLEDPRLFVAAGR